MIELLTDERGFPHFLAALVLLSRIGDVLSTYLVSPTLLLESNAFVRRWGWPLALHGSSFVLRLFREASDGGLAAQRGVGPEREC